MSTHRMSFASSSAPYEVLDRFRQLAADKGWMVVSENSAVVHAQSGLSLRSAGEDMTVSVEPQASGAQVGLVVTPRLGRLQVIDWGEGAAFAREIADWLGATEASQD